MDALDGKGRTPLYLSAKRRDLTLVQALLAAGSTVGVHCGDSGETALDVAAGGGHVDMMRALIRHGADMNAGDSTGVTALHGAALKNQVGAIDALVELGANVDVQGGKDDARWTPLHLASDQGSSEAVCALLRHRADIRRLGKDRCTALHLASRRGIISTVHALLAARASLTFRTSSGDSALDSAASMGHAEVMKVLIQHGARVDATDSYGRTALFKAGEEAVIDALVAAGACVDGVLDISGSTHLHVAYLLGRPPGAFLALLKHGARVDLRNGTGETPLHTASAQGFLEGVQALLEHGVGKNKLTDQGCSPLSLAAENGRPFVTEVLLDAGADVNCLADDGSSALSLAACWGWLKVMEVLVRHGTDVSARDADEGTPLHMAARYNDAGAIDTLITAGACIEAQDDKARTPLVVAFQSAASKCQEDEDYGCSERYTAVTALLKHGANVNQQYTKDRPLVNKRYMTQHYTLLHYSAEFGCPLSVVHALLAADPDLDLRDNDRCTPLHSAIDRPEIVEALLQNGADTDAQDSNGQTPLHKAAENGSVVSVDALVSAGAATSVEDNDGRTPLLVASWKCQRNVMQALLRSGADVTSVDDDGCTALHLAVSRGVKSRSRTLIVDKTSEAVDLLLRWGADESAVNSPHGPFLQGRTAASIWRVIALAKGGWNESRVSVLKLLKRVKRDKTWRRRGWLVLCRLFPDRGLG